MPSPSIARPSSSPDRIVTADIRAVFFDVDFTLICPGPMFGGEGYRAFCARYGMDVDAARFAAAVAGAAPRLDVEGALGAGMRAVLLHRGERRHPMQSELARRGIPVIRSLTELPNLVIG